VYFIIFVSVNQAEKSFDNLSRDELLNVTKELNTIISELNFKNAKLEHELDQIKRLVFGSRKERFVSDTPKEQLSLGFDVEAKEQSKEVPQQTITYSRSKPGKSKKEGAGSRLPLPSHLPREVTILEPIVDLREYKEIGKEITEVLEYDPGKFFVKQYVRPRYVRIKPLDEGTDNVVIAEMPIRFNEKGIFGEGLLGKIIIDKYMDHLPLYRQMKRFKRMGVEIPSSTLSDSVMRTVLGLTPLYELLLKLLKGSGYIEGDETTIKVLDNEKKGKAHLGYYWAYRSPVENIILFDYRRGRGREGPKEFLEGYRGYLQTDGYEVYEYFSDQPGIKLLRCMAHGRRNFIESMQNDRMRSEQALEIIQQLYNVEREAREAKMDYEARYTLRQEKSVGILEELKKWLIKNYQEVLPKSPIGKAIFYMLSAWDRFCEYIRDGRLEIDNNLVENGIRPIAIGRKNYLFAGSHDAAKKAAMIYSLLGTCLINQINPYDWLVDVLKRLPEHPINKLEELLPYKWGNPTTPEKQNF